MSEDLQPYFADTINFLERVNRDGDGSIRRHAAGFQTGRASFDLQYAMKAATALTDEIATLRATLASFQTPAAVELVEACKAWVKADAAWSAALSVWKASGCPDDPDPTDRLVKLKSLDMAEDAIDAAARNFAREPILRGGGVGG